MELWLDFLQEWAQLLFEVPRLGLVPRREQVPQLGKWLVPAQGWPAEGLRLALPLAQLQGQSLD